MVRTRIAPSPTGFPHVGTIFQALFDYVWAHKHNGQFVIRIEDTDQGRLVPGAETALYEALEWVGLEPDEGPKYGGEYGPYRQSERLEIYQQYAGQLIDQGNAYYCFCTPERLDQVRKHMQSQGIPPMYDKHCRHMDVAQAKNRAQTEKYVIRMKVPENETISFTDEIRGNISFESKTVDDQVILKSDGFPTYHLAVVIDDYLMKITHIVRGEEWITSTPKHVLLYRYFDWPVPKIIHTPVLRNPDKSKLSKRHGHASVVWYQEKGYLPEALINFLVTRVWNHPEGKEVFGIDEVIKYFDFKDMHIQGPIADLTKLNWLNGLYIRAMNDQDLARHLSRYKDNRLSQAQLLALIPLIRERLVVLSDIRELTEFMYEYQVPDSKVLLHKADAGLVSSQLQITIDTLTGLSTWTLAQIEKNLRNLQETNNWHKGQYFMLVRVAATGKQATPPLFETLEVIGKVEVLARLKQVQKHVTL